MGASTKINYLFNNALDQAAFRIVYTRENNY
jgi:hypothetical protein